MKRKQPSKCVGSESTDDSDAEQAPQSENHRKKTKTTRSSSKEIFEYKNGTLIVKDSNKNFEVLLEDFRQTLDQSVMTATETEYKPTQFYIPQLGDDIVFIRDGYRSYCETVMKHTALPYLLKYFQTKQTPDGFKRNVSAFPPSIRCVVSKIEYKNILIKELDKQISKLQIDQRKPSRFNFFTLSLTVRGIMIEEIAGSTRSYSVNVGDVFNFDLCYLSDSKPFIITYQHYLKSVNYYKHLRAQMSISMDFIEATTNMPATYTGIIKEIKSEPTEPNCLFETLSILWDTTSEAEEISVWEIKQVEEEAKKVLPRIDATTQARVIQILENFSASAEYLTLPLIQKPPYPILYVAVLGRLQSNFYRTADTLVSDLSHITRCVKQEIPKSKTQVKSMLKYMGEIEKLLNTKKITDPAPGMASEINIILEPTLINSSIVKENIKEEKKEMKSKKVINSEDEATESSDSDNDATSKTKQSPKVSFNPTPSITAELLIAPLEPPRVDEPSKEVPPVEDKTCHLVSSVEGNVTASLPLTASFYDIPKIARKHQTKPEVKPPSPTIETHPVQPTETCVAEPIQPTIHPTSILESTLPSIRKKGEDKQKDDKKSIKEDKKEEKEKKEKKKEEKKEKKEEKKERKEKKKEKKEEKKEKKEEAKEKKKDDKEKKKSEPEEKKKTDPLKFTLKIPQPPQNQQETDLSFVKIPKRKKEVIIPISEPTLSDIQSSSNNIIDNLAPVDVVDAVPNISIIPQPNPIQEELVHLITTSETIEPRVHEVIHPEEIGGIDSKTCVYIPQLEQKPKLPSITLKTSAKKRDMTYPPKDTIFEIEEYRNYNEIILSIQTENNKIKVSLGKNSNFDPIEAEHRKIWNNRLNNHFRHLGTTTSSELISHAYGSVSKKTSKNMNLSLPVFSTNKSISVSREMIPVHLSCQIPKQLFRNKYENILFYEQKRLVLVDHLLKVPIAHYQVHVIREDSNIMEDENQGKITFNIKCDTTESERINFFSLFDKVVEARRICKNPQALFQFPEPQKLFNLKDNFGFMVDNMFDWFIEGFYFKERIGKNQSLSPYGVYYVAEFVFMENNTEISVDFQ